LVEVGGEEDGAGVLGTREILTLVQLLCKSGRVTRVLQGCYEGVTRVLRGCYEGVTSDEQSVARSQVTATRWIRKTEA
jgi:hypothetical protein